MNLIEEEYDNEIYEKLYFDIEYILEIYDEIVKMYLLFYKDKIIKRNDDDINEIYIDYNKNDIDKFWFYNLVLYNACNNTYYNYLYEDKTTKFIKNYKMMTYESIDARNRYIKLALINKWIIPNYSKNDFTVSKVCLNTLTNNFTNFKKRLMHIKFYLSMKIKYT